MPLSQTRSYGDISSYEVPLVLLVQAHCCTLNKMLHVRQLGTNQCGFQSGDICRGSGLNWQVWFISSLPTMRKSDLCLFPTSNTSASVRWYNSHESGLTFYVSSASPSLCAAADLLDIIFIGSLPPHSPVFSKFESYGTLFADPNSVFNTFCTSFSNLV